MMIQKNYKKADAITLKTISGEEVVARFVEDDNFTMTIEKPMAVMMTQNGPGLGPWTVTTHPDVKLQINKSAVIFTAKTDNEMAKQYIEATSGIKMV